MPTEVSKMKNREGKEKMELRRINIRRKILFKFVDGSGRSLYGCIFQLYFEDGF